MKVSAAALKKARAKVSKRNAGGWLEDYLHRIVVTFEDTDGSVEKYKLIDGGLVPMNSIAEEIEEHPGEFADLFQYQ